MMKINTFSGGGRVGKTRILGSVLSAVFLFSGVVTQVTKVFFYKPQSFFH